MTYGFHEGRFTTRTICLGAVDPSEADIDPKHTVPPFTGPCLGDERGAINVGPVARVAYVLKSCTCNLQNAICKRHAVTQPDVTVQELPVLDYIARDLNRVRARLTERAPAPGTDPWMERWPRSKREAIEKSILVHKMRPGVVKSFPKRECNVNYFDEEPAKARGIHGYGTLHTQEYRAREFTELQKAVFGEDVEYGDDVLVTFASGMDADAIAAWAARSDDAVDGVWYERDGKAWDATMAEFHMRFKTPYYELIPGLSEFARESFTVTCYGGRAAKYTYKLCGTTKSGHNDTTLGNSIVNAAIAANACILLGLRARIIVAGDDLLAKVSWTTSDALAELEAQHGITPKAACHRNVESASFISGCFMRCGDRLRFGPKPGRLLAKLFWTHKDPGKHFDKHAFTVAIGMLHIRGWCPLIGLWLRSVRDASGRSVARRTTYPARVDPKLVAHRFLMRTVQWDADLEDVDESAYAALCRRYRLTMSELDEVITFLQGCTGPGVVRSSLIDRILAVDLADFPSPPVGDWPADTL